MIFRLFVVIGFFIALGIQAFVWLATYHFDWIKPMVTALGIKSTNVFQIFYHVSDLCILGYFYSMIIKKFSLVKWLGFSLAAACVVNYLFIEGPHVYGVFNPNVDAFFNFLFPMIYMWGLFNSPSLVPITKNPFFWFCLGLIIANLLSLFMFFVGDKLFKTDFPLYVKIFYVSNLSSILGYVFYCIGFYYSRYAKYLPQN